MGGDVVFCTLTQLFFGNIDSMGHYLVLDIIYAS